MGEIDYFTRADGWPLCPVCEEDELYSLFNWDGRGEKPPLEAWLDDGLKCYLCDSEFSRVYVKTQRLARKVGYWLR
jgi:hypothetical protein